MSHLCFMGFVVLKLMAKAIAVFFLPFAVRF
jgi:hypothetical protein